MIEFKETKQDEMHCKHFFRISVNLTPYSGKIPAKHQRSHLNYDNLYNSHQ